MQIGFDAPLLRRSRSMLRGRVDVRAMLAHYGAENCSDQMGRDGTTEVLHSCILDRVDRHHQNGDAHPSACANIEKGLYVCYSGHFSGDVLSVIAKMESLSIDALLSSSSTRDVVDSMLVDAVHGATQVADEIAALMNPAQSTPTALGGYSDRVLDPWRFAHPYLYDDRGISMDAIAELSLGYDQTENRIVFPHFFGGRLLGWQKRAIPARPGRWPGTTVQTPKYVSSSGLPKSETLYGYDLTDHRQPVIVVESPISVARARSLGVTNVVATFGASTSAAQCALLRGFPRVYLWYDADEAGRRGQSAAVGLLRRHTDVRVVEAERDHDLADCMSVEEVNRKIDTSVSWLWKQNRIVTGRRWS